MHAFDLSTQELGAYGSLEFWASLIYRANSRTASAIQRTPVLTPPIFSSKCVCVCVFACVHMAHGTFRSSDDYLWELVLLP